MQREVTASIKTELFSKSDQTVLNSKSECNIQQEVTSSIKSDQTVVFKIIMQKHATISYFIT